MISATDKYTQNAAIFLIVFGAVCIGVGCYFGWRDLVNFATAFGGGGVGILTGSKISSMTNKEGGTINVNPGDADKV